jgi:hypothetical protein
MERTRSTALGAVALVALGAAIAAGPRRRAGDAPVPPGLPPPPAENPGQIVQGDAITREGGARGDDPRAAATLLDELLARPRDAGARAAPLPLDAPESVRFGVILVTYRGAQGAPPDARSRDEARELAADLARDARGGVRQFRAAARRGDRGSTANAGRIGRGVLEPDVERALFLLAPGEVGEPIDTPRGFWVARRIE